MKKLTLLCLSPLVFANLALAGGVNAPAYSHGHAKKHAGPPRYFNGFSITGAVGGIAGQLDAQHNFFGADSAEVLENYSAKNGPGGFEFTLVDELTGADSLELMDVNVAGLIALEYAYQFHNGIVLGLAVTAGFDNVSFENVLEGLAQPSVTDSSEDLTDTFLNYNSFSSRFTTELKNDYAVLFKPGFVIRENTLVYGLVGPRWGNFESSLSTTFNSNGVASIDTVSDTFVFGWNETLTGEDSHSEYQVGITAGLGVRQVLVNHVMLGLEYAFTHYGDLSSLQNGTGPSGVFFRDSQGLPTTTPTDLLMKYATQADDLVLNTHTFMATLTYKF